MGTVWRARHRLLARDAAVKLVKHEALGDTESAAQAQLRRFEREAQATALLQFAAFHPPVRFRRHRRRQLLLRDGAAERPRPRIADQGVRPAAARAGDVPAAARSVIRWPKRTRAAWCIATSSRPTSSCAAWGWNSISSRCSTSGWCRRARSDPSTAVTETLATAQQLIGTPAYMAPEMILGRDDVDRRADVYAIGCVAFYLLTGTRVFQDGTRCRSLIDHVHAEPVPPSSRLGRRIAEGSRSRSSSIVSARIRTTGRTMPPSCWQRIASYHLARPVVRAHTRRRGGRRACRTSPGRSLAAASHRSHDGTPQPISGSFGV